MTKDDPKEIPLSLMTPLVRKTVEGEKTVTRRICVPQPPYYLTSRGGPREIAPRLWGFAASSGGTSAVRSEDTIKCRYGTKGDLLWIRETHLPLGEGAYVYRANMPTDHSPAPGDGGWKPGRFMPKDAARLWLRVLSVRLERLQQITAEDVIREGLRPRVGYARTTSWAGPVAHPVLILGETAKRYRCRMLDDGATWTKGAEKVVSKASLRLIPVDRSHSVEALAYVEGEYETWMRTHFASAWDKVQASRDPDYSWNADPWVWRIEYVLHANSEPDPNPSKQREEA